MRHNAALVMAEYLIECLRPACQRIEIAGSIRRGRPEVKDIEILAMPDLTAQPRPRLMFGQKPPSYHRTMLDRILAELCQTVTLRAMNKGERYKKFLYIRDGRDIMLDLFVVLPPAQWGVQMVIRTGPNKPENNFSQWMVTPKSKGGALPDECMVREGRVVQAWSEDAAGRPIAMPEEADFFRLCGMNYIEPKDRQAKWGQQQDVGQIKAES